MPGVAGGRYSISCASPYVGRCGSEGDRDSSDDDTVPLRDRPPSWYAGLLDRYDIGVFSNSGLSNIKCSIVLLRPLEGGRGGVEIVHDGESSNRALEFLCVRFGRCDKRLLSGSLSIFDVSSGNVILL